MPDADILDLKVRVSRLEGQVANLNTSMAEIRATLGQTATKADVARLGENLRSKIDGAVNGLLSKALDAIPANEARSWQIIFGAMALVTTLVTVGLAIMSFFHPH